MKRVLWILTGIGLVGLALLSRANVSSAAQDNLSPPFPLPPGLTHNPPGLDTHRNPLPGQGGGIPPGQRFVAPGQTITPPGQVRNGSNGPVQTNQDESLGPDDLIP